MKKTCKSGAAYYWDIMAKAWAFFSIIFFSSFIIFKALSRNVAQPEQAALLIKELYKLRKELAFNPHLDSHPHDAFMRHQTGATLAEARNTAKEMFYDSLIDYLVYAYPMDELAPISCSGYNTWGDYSLTLIDAVDTLAVFGDKKAFELALHLITDHLNFDYDYNVSMFETNIRILGGLLSAHYFAVKLGIESYKGELVDIAYDLGIRMLPAFNTSTGIPYNTINLKYGVPVGETPVTCAACAGTFALEFGWLSRVTGDPLFEFLSTRSVRAMWHKRSDKNLLGDHIDSQSGHWISSMTGIAGNVDSFFEYMNKASIAFNNDEFRHIFEESYRALESQTKDDIWYFDANMYSGMKVDSRFSSLQAYWPWLQALNGHIGEALKNMKFLGYLQSAMVFLPENLNYQSGWINNANYPLRPELAESTMGLYQTTHDPYLLHFGYTQMYRIKTRTRAKCGYCTVGDVTTGSLLDRMESFFLSETLKYFYLLFSPNHYILKENYIFTTEAHPFPILKEGDFSKYAKYQNTTKTKFFADDYLLKPVSEVNYDPNTLENVCSASEWRTYVKSQSREWWHLQMVLANEYPDIEYLALNDIPIGRRFNISEEQGTKLLGYLSPYRLPDLFSPSSTCIARDLVDYVEELRRQHEAALQHEQHERDLEDSRKAAEAMQREQEMDRVQQETKLPQSESDIGEVSEETEEQLPSYLENLPIEEQIKRMNQEQDALAQTMRNLKALTDQLQLSVNLQDLAASSEAELDARLNEMMEKMEGITATTEDVKSDMEELFKASEKDKENSH